MCELLWNGWSWLIDIPAQFWGPVTAASIAVAGALLGLYQNAKRQIEQHSFDASQKRTELQLELRREVYLDLATAFQDMQMFLGKMFQTPAEQTDEIGKFSEAMIKLSMVSDIATAKLAHQANSRYMIAYIALSDLANAPRYSLKCAAEQKDKAVVARARAEAVAAEIDKFTHAPNFSPILLKALLDRLGQFEAAAVAHDAEEQRMMEEHNRHTVTYVQKYIEQSQALQGNYVDLLVAIRVELEQPTNLQEFRDSLDQSLREPLDVLRKKMGDLEVATAVQ